MVGAVRLFKTSFSFFFLGSLVVVLGPKGLKKMKEVGIYRVRMYTRVSIKTKAHIDKRKFAKSKFIEVNHIDIV